MKIRLSIQRDILEDEITRDLHIDTLDELVELLDQWSGVCALWTFQRCVDEYDEWERDGPYILSTGEAVVADRPDPTIGLTLHVGADRYRGPEEDDPNRDPPILGPLKSHNLARLG